jgi:succinyl-CoA synthetase beta subunit
VIKAQVLAGGRGKGHFDNGFKGGVHLTKDPAKVNIIYRYLLHSSLNYRIKIPSITQTM